ncbi:MAG: arsenite methyltransferase [Candidatus Hodarchaeota archaeon]
MDDEKIKKAVRESYAKIAKQSGSCCGSKGPSSRNPDLIKDASKKMGYSREELEAAPEGSNLGLGCGNPVAISSLKEGDTVLDLGSGAGFDCFLAASKVGENGKVIGVDMTAEMIDRARENARKDNYKNVEFRLGEIENLPVADNSVDVIISNCVINLAPDKRKVFKEAFRVLKPGGRLMVSDIVLYNQLPDIIKNSVEAYSACISGAMMKDDYLDTIKAAGFRDLKITDERSFSINCVNIYDPKKDTIDRIDLPQKDVENLQNAGASISIFAIKPNEIS